MSVKQDLIDSLAYLREHGWTQKTLMDENGCVCGVGAILMAVRGEVCWGPIGHRGRERAMDARGALVDIVDHSSISLWNDDPGRTQAEVEAAFERAIEAQS